MKNISVVFSKHKGFNVFSGLIKLGLNTPFSHVAIKMTDGDTGQVVYYQASGMDINCVSEEAFLNQEDVVCEKDIQVSEEIYIKGKTFAISQLGKPYSMPAIFGFAVQILLGCFGVKITNPAKNNGSQYVCSQFAAAYIENAEGIELDVTNMTPKALYELMPSLPSVLN